MVDQHEVRAGVGFHQVARQDAAVAHLRLAVAIVIGGVDLKDLRGALIRHHADRAFVVVVVIAIGLGRERRVIPQALVDFLQQLPAPKQRLSTLVVQGDGADSARRVDMERRVRRWKKAATEQPGL